MLSIPTWIFRSSGNVGEDDGWIFFALGHDDTGGMLDIVRSGCSTGHSELANSEDIRNFDSCMVKPVDLDRLKQLLSEKSMRTRRWRVELH